MQVHTDPSQLPSFYRSVITIGTFDGVHRGHRRIIRQLVETAREVGGKSVIVTFHPHPRSILNPEAPPVQLLTTAKEQVRLLEELGVNHLVIIPFTKSFAAMEAEQYISEFLVSLFRPNTIIIGHDHRFGKGRRGSYEMLEASATRFGYTVQELDAELLQEAAISSTRIREALAAGDVSLANELLGYTFTFGGRVVPGDRRGRTIGFPTANISVDDRDKIMPADGVYAVWADVGGQRHGGMMNLGTRPTVDGRTHSTEVHLFQFNEDIYGQHLEVSVLGRIRSEQRFANLEALQAQLSEDRRQAMGLLQGG